MILNKNYEIFIKSFFVIFFFGGSIRFVHSSDCYPIEQCTPEISALDFNSINKTIEIRCTFKNKIANPLDIIWKVKFERGERMAYDADGHTMAPFKHQIFDVTRSNSNSQYSISVLYVPLLNASYFTNYTIVSVRGSCYNTIRINLKERALGYTNNSVKPTLNISIAITFVNLLIFYLNIIK